MIPKWAEGGKTVARGSGDADREGSVRGVIGRDARAQGLQLGFRGG